MNTIVYCFHNKDEEKERNWNFSKNADVFCLVVLFWFFGLVDYVLMALSRTIHDRIVIAIHCFWLDWKCWAQEFYPWQPWCSLVSLLFDLFSYILRLLKGIIRTYLLLFSHSAFSNKRNNDFLSFARGLSSLFFCFPLLYQYKIFIADISMGGRQEEKNFYYRIIPLRALCER